MFIHITDTAMLLFLAATTPNAPQQEQDPAAMETDAPADPCTDAPSSRECKRWLRQIKNLRIEKIIDGEERTFRGALKYARRARCATALCWGPSYKWALEPLVEMPVGKTFSLPGSSLSQYMNSNEIQVSFNAGLRAWLWWDWVSVSVYMSKVVITGNDAINTSTSGFALPVSQMRRPFPGLGIGLFGDILWLSVDYDQLRNGNSPSTKSPDFPANSLVSHAFTFTLAIAPIAGIRNGIGTAVEQRRRKEQTKQVAAARAQGAGERAPPVGEADPQPKPPPSNPQPEPPPASPSPSPTDGGAAAMGVDPPAVQRLSLLPRRG